MLGLLLATAVLAGLFLSVLRQQDATLQNPVVDLRLFASIRRDDRVYRTGETLAGTLTSRTLRGGPYLLQGTVSVPQGSTVRIAPGVTIAAEEDAQLVVEGVLIADRATFISNHRHPQRQIWNGLTAVRGGSIFLTQVTVADASAALTCGARGTLTGNTVQLTGDAVGLVALPGHARCVLRNAHITDARVGLSFVGGAATAEHITFNRVGDAVRVYHEARPHLAHLVMQHLRGFAIRYAATPTLAVTALSLLPGADAALLVIDGHDTPIHEWRGEKHPTGYVALR